MQFGKQVVMFDFSGIPMVGNLDNGFVIGLTENGADLCQKLQIAGLTDEEARNQDEALYECLAANGFFDEKRIPRGLNSAYLHVTQRCNLNCKGCYSLDDTRNALPDAPTSQLLRAIEQLAAFGCRTLFISGGEPFLRDDLPQLVRHAKESDIRNVTVITNGTHLRRDTLEAMAPYVDTIAVSFDGYSPKSPAYIREEQRFEELVDGMKLIQSCGIAAHITPTIHAKNFADLQRYTELAQSLGATMNYSLLSCEYGDSGLDELLPDEASLEHLGASMAAMGSSLPSSKEATGVNLNVSVNCGAGVKEVSIGADGTVYPCHMLHRPEWALGNVFVTDLDHILQGEQARELAALHVSNLEGCSTCNHKYLCGGGCRARSLYKFGDLNHSDAYCTMMRTYYDTLGQSLSSQLE